MRFAGEGEGGRGEGYNECRRMMLHVQYISYYIKQYASPVTSFIALECEVNVL
jgi:hypothetical protein